VCYDAHCTCKLSCGHSLCMGCAKTWFAKAGDDGPTCPMCRAPMNFCGMKALKYELENNRYEQQCSEVFSEIFDFIFYYFIIQEIVHIPPRLHPQFTSAFFRQMVNIERKMKIMRCQGDSVGDMRLVLWGWVYEYHAKYTWVHDPILPQIPYIPPHGSVSFSCQV